ncbi:MAG: hypothetical protein ACREO5_04130 [Candidatus Binatia bacterium]
MEELPLRGFWQLFRGGRKEDQAQERDAWETVELRYTPDDLVQLEDDGRSVRGTGAGLDAHSQSQIVRAVGAIIDQKEGRLLTLNKQDQKITVEYESRLKQRISEDFTVSSLYDYWVRMYLKRGGPR